MNRLLTSTAVACGLALALSAPASAQSGGEVLQADLAAQNDSGARATATVTLNDDDTMTVAIEGSGFRPGEAPHAQHIHGVVGQNSSCPTMAQDADGDGIVTTSEGAAVYGPILVSLTTEGDMTDASGLAVDRMPVAGADGSLTYERTFDIPANVGDDIDALHIVQHGVDFDGDGAYGGDRKSDLDPSLPAEATDPASCGELVAMPSGGVQTGGGYLADHIHDVADTDGSPVSSSTATVAAVLAAGGVLAVGGRRLLRRSEA